VRSRIREKERRRTGRAEGDGNFLTRIVIPRVPNRKRAIPLHPDQRKNGVRHCGNPNLVFFVLDPKLVPKTEF
jgi:hypothetical protein